MEQEKTINKYTLPISIILAGLMIAGGIYTSKQSLSDGGSKIFSPQTGSTSAIEEKVLPSEGVTLPVVWGNIGKQLVNSGTIDEKRFRAIYEKVGRFTNEYQKLLVGQNNERLRMTKENAGFLLNMFWALGLSNKNKILESGDMTDPRYGGAGSFASTGGWTMSEGDVMNHYSHHSFMTLTPEQQMLVERVSKGIYRPCCDNSVHFPDCNHGMAMLGLLELMASQGATEKEMWDAALAVNSYWFPNTYIILATYVGGQGIDWDDVNSQDVLGADFSSSSGFARIATQVKLPSSSVGKGGCGVDSESPIPQRQQSGCGI